MKTNGEGKRIDDCFQAVAWKLSIGLPDQITIMQ
jgi:hypothetical protein